MSDTPKTVKYFLLASGGYLTEPRVDVLEFSEDDEEFDPEEETFEEYVEYHTNDAKAEYEQGFSQTFVISEELLPQFLTLIKNNYNERRD